MAFKDDKEKILGLLKTDNPTNHELALQLMESQFIDLPEFFNPIKKACQVLSIDCESKKSMVELYHQTTIEIKSKDFQKLNDELDSFDNLKTLILAHNIHAHLPESISNKQKYFKATKSYNVLVNQVNVIRPIIGDSFNQENVKYIVDEITESFDSILNYDWSNREVKTIIHRIFDSIIDYHKIYCFLKEVRMMWVHKDEQTKVLFECTPDISNTTNSFPQVVPDPDEISVMAYGSQKEKFLKQDILSQAFRPISDNLQFIVFYYYLVKIVKNDLVGLELDTNSKTLLTHMLNQIKEK